MDKTQRSFKCHYCLRCGKRRKHPTYTRTLRPLTSYVVCKLCRDYTHLDGPINFCISCGYDVSKDPPPNNACDGPRIDTNFAHTVYLYGDIVPFTAQGREDQLPSGWEQIQDPLGQPYFINYDTNERSLHDPRILQTSGPPPYDASQQGFQTGPTRSLPLQPEQTGRPMQTINGSNTVQCNVCLS